MATTRAFLSHDLHRIKLLCTSDGNGGGAVTISNADLVGSSGFGANLGSPALRPLSKVYTNQAAARTALNEGSAFSIRAIPRDGVAQWLVDVNVDGNGKATVIVTASGISSNAVVEIIMEYSEVK